MNIDFKINGLILFEINIQSSKHIQKIMKKKKLLILSLFVAAILSASSVLAQTTVVSIGVNDTLGTTIRNNSSVSDLTIVIPAGYTSPEGSAITIKNIDLTATYIPINSNLKRLTIKGDGTYPTLKVQLFVLPSTLTSLLKFQNLNLVGANATVSSNYILNNATANPVPAVDTVAFEGCKVTNVRGVIRYQTANTTYKNINFKNCILANIGSYGVIGCAASSALNNVLVQNSTIYGVITNTFVISPAVPTTFTMSNCTIDNVNGSSTSKYLIDLGSSNTTTALSISNSILGKATTAANKGIRGGTGFTYTVTNSYKTSDWVTSGGSAVVGFTDYTSASTALFVAPTTFDGTNNTATEGDYNIKDGTFAGANSAGDPRWYTPAIKLSALSIGGFNYTTGGLLPSTEKTFSISADHISSALTLNAPADYEISSTTGSGFSNSLMVGATGKLAATTIYVRLKGGLADNAYNNENITIDGTGLSTQNVNCNGYVGIATAINTPLTTNFLSKNANGISLSEEGNISIFTFSGALVKNAYVQKGMEMSLSKGNYIIKLINKEGIKVQKIVL